MKNKRRRAAWLSVAIAATTAGWLQSPSAAQAANVYVDTTAELQSAMQNAAPGDTILVAPGTYEDTSSTTVGSKPAYFYGNADGSSSAPITVKSQDPANPAVLKGGNIANGGYTLYITGDYWVVEDLHVTHGQKGIMLDHANHVRIDGATVYHVGQEGIHVRDGSDYAVIENSTVRDTGATGDSTDMGFAEGIYIGSDRSVWDENNSSGYDRQVHHTIVRNNTIGPGVAAESMDIKEGTSDTLVEGNVFLGEGISGLHYADSFIDNKGVNATVRNNVFYRQNNAEITKDIAEINRTSTNPWCPSDETSNGSLPNTADGNTYTDNTFHEGSPPSDATAPSAPTNVAATGASSSQIDVAWSASSDNVGVAGYRVFRDGVQVGTTSSTSYTDTGLTASTTYSYAVRAYDAAGNVSASSGSAEATTTAGSGGTPPPTNASLELHYEEGDGGDAADNDIRPYFLIVNNGDTAVPLSELKIRYYFKKDSAVSQRFTADYAAIGKSNVTGAFGSVGSPTPEADAYLEVGFASGAGNVAAGDDTGNIKTRITNEDWSNHNETNDYSYDASYGSYAAYDRVTLYRNGVLIWGMEP
ncbi:right-handed parallel beta-helix repeat-containing protein [Paenibacillus sp. TRM 82003]|nr:right-handed parallel beta-helix repeat-containing protein [Paenibacillus sp. TRM 82003]